MSRGKFNPELIDSVNKRGLFNPKPMYKINKLISNKRHASYASDIHFWNRQDKSYMQQWRDTIQ